MRGRKPTPNEVKRRRGTARPDRVPDELTVIALRPADGVPAPPGALGREGQRLWQLCWEGAIQWLSPFSDETAVERACHLADDLAIARERYRETRAAQDGRVVVNFSHELGVALASLGFDPTARTRLGVAEVTAVSKIEKLRR